MHLACWSDYAISWNVIYSSIWNVGMLIFIFGNNCSTFVWQTSLRWFARRVWHLHRKLLLWPCASLYTWGTLLVPFLGNYLNLWQIDACMQLGGRKVRYFIIRTLIDKSIQFPVLCEWSCFGWVNVSASTVQILCPANVLVYVLYLWWGFLCTLVLFVWNTMLSWSKVFHVYSCKLQLALIYLLTAT